MLRLIITARPRLGPLIVVLVLYGIASVVMFGPWPGLVGRVRERCGGLAALDVRGYWSMQDAQSLVRACGAGGRDAYVDLQLADLVYPAIVGTALLLVSAALLHRYGPWTWPLLLPALATTALDYGENAAAWTLLVRWPQVDAMVASIGGPVSAVKQALGFVAFGVVLVLLTLAAARQVQSRVRRRERAHTPA
jgi:hypothetical protein